MGGGDRERVKIETFYSHQNGFEFIQYHMPEVWDELVAVVAAVDAPAHQTKVSQEKTMAGKLLFAPIELNKAFGHEFQARGWQSSVTEYWVTADEELILKTIPLPAPEQKWEIEAAGKTAIYSYNQTDFVKRRVAIEVQFGKYSFVAFDLFVKHMAFYIGRVIDVGIEVLPMKAMQAMMSSGPGYYERELYNLLRQGRGTPAVPLVIVGIVP